MKLISVSLAILLLCVCKNKSFSLYESMSFRLYKRELLTTFTLLNKNASELVKNELFDPKLPTRMYIHGYFGSEQGIENYSQHFLNVSDYNFIAIDWTKGARTINYYIAKARVPLVSSLFFISKLY